MIVFRSCRFRKASYGLAATGLFLLSACTSRALLAQDATASPQTSGALPKPPLAFDVATIKPIDPNAMHMMEVRVYPGGRLTLYTQSFPMLIAEAFDVGPWQIVGGDRWLKAKYFNIEGLPPESIRSRVTEGEYTTSGLKSAEEREMLQRLLIDRFHLKYHVDKQSGTVFLLKRGDGPLRLEAVETNLYTRSADGSMNANDGYPTGDIGVVSGKPLGFHQTSMAQLAMALSGAQAAPVIDETQLSGFHSFRSQTVVTREDFNNGGLAHLLLEAVPEMGLKLVKTQGTVEKFVIDSAELPTPN